MPSIICTKCDAVLKASKVVEPGTQMKCPRCKKSFVVEEDDEAEEPKKSNCLVIALSVVGVVLLLCCTSGGVSTWWFWPNIKGWLGDTEIIAKDKIEKKDEKTIVVTAESITQEMLDDFKAADAKYK